MQLATFVNTALDSSSVKGRIAAVNLKIINKIMSIRFFLNLPRDRSLSSGVLSLKKKKEFDKKNSIKTYIDFYTTTSKESGKLHRNYNITTNLLNTFYQVFDYFSPYIPTFHNLDTHSYRKNAHPCLCILACHIYNNVEGFSCYAPLLQVVPISLNPELLDR